MIFYKRRLHATVARRQGGKNIFYKHYFKKKRSNLIESAQKTQKPKIYNFFKSSIDIGYVLKYYQISSYEKARLILTLKQKTNKVYYNN